MCLDTGHAYVTGATGDQQATLLREHGDRISHVHLNDTRIDGDDEYLPVGLGRVDFESRADAMSAADRRGTCTYEVFTFEYSQVRSGKATFDGLLSSARSS